MASKKTFKECLNSVPALISWVEKQDVSELKTFLLSNPAMPMIGIASGGSFSSAVYASMLYSAYRGIARAVTPLMLASISDEALKNSKLLFLSKSGKGFDADYVIQRALSVSQDNVACITRSDSDDNVAKKKLENCFCYHWEDYDGFIATLSPFAIWGVCYKAFTGQSDMMSKLEFDSRSAFEYSTKRGMSEPRPFNEIRNYLVIYSGWSEPVAVDFESKMVEAGYASVQMCDYRNFTHGRFMFLSNHLEDSVLVLLITPREKEFVRQLIYDGKDRSGKELFPSETQIVTIETELDSPLASIDLLIKQSLFFAEVGEAFGYEPCNPKNPAKIDKRIPKNIRYKGLKKMGTLKIMDVDES